MVALRTHLINLVPVITHALAALLPLAWYAVSHPLPSLWLIPLAIVVGNLPDIDSSYSHVGRLVFPLARFIERRWGHRTITHNLPAVGLVALLTWPGSAYVPWLWPWLPIFYFSHLLLDMVVGQMGVPLLWPWKIRFTLFGGKVQGSSDGEKWLAAGLTGVCVLAFYIGDWSPGYTLHRMAGTVAFAQIDYREWQGMYQVYAVVDGTWNDTNQRVDGARYEIVGAEGETLLLSDSGRTFTAGTTDQDMYVRRIVAEQGEQLAPSTPASPTPTPQIVLVRVQHVYDPDAEILVKPGQVITKGQKLADLTTWKERKGLLDVEASAEAEAEEFIPTPTPTETPTPEPTPEPVDPLALDRAWAELELARAQATVAAAPVPQPTIEACNVAVEELRAELWRKQLERDALVARDNPNKKQEWAEVNAANTELGFIEGRITEEQTRCDGLASAQHADDPERLQVAAARLRLAEIEYQAALVKLTPTATPIPTPTRTPTPTKTPRPTPTAKPTPEAEIFAMVNGYVSDVRVISVMGNEATIEIIVHVGAHGPPRPAGNVPTSSGLAAALVPGRTSAVVVSVSDGDTATFSIGGVEEKARFIGVDTPETVHPGKSVECYGPEASAYTRSMLPAGSPVALEFDREKRDKYGRLLVYVWLPDGQMLNRLLIAQGYARPLKIPPNITYSMEFDVLATDARVQGQGLWGVCE